MACVSISEYRRLSCTSSTRRTTSYGLISGVTSTAWRYGISREAEMTMQSRWRMVNLRGYPARRVRKAGCKLACAAACSFGRASLRARLCSASRVQARAISINVALLAGSSAVRASERHCAARCRYWSLELTLYSLDTLTPGTLFQTNGDNVACAMLATRVGISTQSASGET